MQWYGFIPTMYLYIHPAQETLLSFFFKGNYTVIKREAFHGAFLAWWKSPNLALVCTQLHWQSKAAQCVCLHSGTKSYTLAVQLLLLPHAPFYLLMAIHQDKNNGFLECRKLQEVVIRKGARGQKVQLLELLLLPPSLRMNWLMEGAETF